MLDRIHEYTACLAEPHRWAIATVTEVSGSVPRPPGTSMAVRDDALTIGSVSGGCVEAAVVHQALDCIEAGRSTIADFGYSDDDAFAVGLTCGGDLRVLIQPLTHLADAARQLLAGPAPDGPVATGQVLVRVLPDDDAAPNVLTRSTSLPAVLDVAGPAGELPAGLAAALGPAAGDLLALARRGGVGVLTVLDRDRPDCPTLARLLVESPASVPRMVIYGANDYSAALARLASLVNWHVVVCDARSVFATAARHPGAHEVVVRRPVNHLREQLDAGRLDAGSAVVILTHDPKFDLPVLDLALRTPVGYVGAMGSRRTHERRAQELLHGGLPAHCLARLHSPIGLDIGARTPQEVAVAVLAEIIAVRAGKDTGSGVLGLHRTAGPVHDPQRRAAPAGARELRGDAQVAVVR